MGTGLTGRTLGVVGAGRIGKELLRMAKSVRPEAARRRSRTPSDWSSSTSARARSPLAELMAQSDFVVVTCLLNEETRAPGRRGASSR